MLNNIFFSSGGFYALYNHLGAIEELHNEYNKKDSKISRDVMYYGVSAGAITSILCYLVLEGLITFDKSRELINFMNVFDIFDFNITTIAITMLDRLFECCPPDLHKRISNVIHIGVTTQNGYKQISDFASNADIYNVILCSCTIAGVSNYDSQIDGETCIDGVYSFNSGYNLPPDTLIVKLELFSIPLSLTIPPYTTQGFLVEMGRQKVIDYTNGNRAIINEDGDNIEKFRLRDLFGTNGWLFIHGLTYKNPIWKKHIEFKTNSKLSDSTDLHIGFFDIINYIHYSVLNHRH